MGSKSNYLENKLLDAVLNATSFTSPATVYLALFTAPPTDAGGGTEVTGGSYARVAVTANTTNFPAASGGQVQNGTAITFATASADWGTIIAWGLFDDPTAGNLLYWGMMVGTEFAFARDAASNTLRAPGSAFVNGQKIWVEPGTIGSLPTGLSAGTSYFIVSASGDTFQLALTVGGSAVVLSGDGTGRIGPSLEKPIYSGNTPTFDVATLTIIED